MTKPKFVKRVLKALAFLAERKGSSTKDLLRYMLKTSKSPSRNLTMKVQKALKLAVSSGLVRLQGGRYKVCRQKTSVGQGDSPAKVVATKRPASAKPAASRSSESKSAAAKPAAAKPAAAKATASKLLVSKSPAPKAPATRASTSRQPTPKSEVVAQKPRRRQSSERKKRHRRRGSSRSSRREPRSSKGQKIPQPEAVKAKLPAKRPSREPRK